MTISNDTTYELTFTVTDFSVVTQEQLYDILSKEFKQVVIAAHQPDENNKNTHYHAMLVSDTNYDVPSDYPNKSAQEQAARRRWKKILGTIEGVTRIHYGRVEEQNGFLHYILVKAKSYLADPYYVEYGIDLEEIQQVNWCADKLENGTCKHCSSLCKVSKKTTQTFTQFELIMREWKKDRICQHVAEGVCEHCFDNGVIQRAMIKYYLKKGKAVPIGKVAEMMLSAKAMLAPTQAKYDEAEDDLMNAVHAKIANNLKIY